jgi:hypothetical protein
MKYEDKDDYLCFWRCLAYHKMNPKPGDNSNIITMMKYLFKDYDKKEILPHRGTIRGRISKMRRNFFFHLKPENSKHVPVADSAMADEAVEEQPPVRRCKCRPPSGIAELHSGRHCKLLLKFILKPHRAEISMQPLSKMCR